MTKKLRPIYNYDDEVGPDAKSRPYTPEAYIYKFDYLCEPYFHVPIGTKFKLGYVEEGHTKLVDGSFVEW